MSLERIRTHCCIVGGGPAGMVLGYLLARAGVQVTVLEKHKDFFRDFRGDTVHPSTLELMYELGLLDEFLQRPHEKITSIRMQIGDFSFQAGNLEKLRTHCRFVAIMPQWDFLNFLAEQAKRYPTFDLRMEHEATALRMEAGRARGVEVHTPNGLCEIEADLLVACDGRHSTIRKSSGLALKELGVPIDVLWFRISRKEEDEGPALGHVDYGKALVLINRRDYFQAGLLIRKDGFDEVKRRGLQVFREDVAQLAPFLRDRVDEITTWEQVKLLSVQVNRLRRWWRPGLLCIGDAAHAMSPVFGIGVNLAVQDAVAAASVLARPLRDGEPVDGLLREVQMERELRARVVQRLQVMVHAGFNSLFQRPKALHPAWPIRLLMKSGAMQPILLYGVGMGIVPKKLDLDGKWRVLRRDRMRRAMALGAGMAAGCLVLLIRAHRRT